MTEMGTLTEQLMRTDVHWRRLIAPVAEYVAKRLLVTPGDASRRTDKVNLKTPLTQENRSRGRNGVRKRAEPLPRRPSHLLDRMCVACGTSVRRNTKLCPQCRMSR